MSLHLRLAVRASEDPRSIIGTTIIFLSTWIMTVTKKINNQWHISQGLDFIESPIDTRNLYATIIEFVDDSDGWYILYLPKAKKYIQWKAQELIDWSRLSKANLIYTIVDFAPDEGIYK